MQGDRRAAGHASGNRCGTFEGGEAENTTGGSVDRARGGQHNKVSSAPPLHCLSSQRKDPHKNSTIVSAEHVHILVGTFACVKIDYSGKRKSVS